MTNGAYLIIKGGESCKVRPFLFEMKKSEGVNDQYFIFLAIGLSIRSDNLIAYQKYGYNPSIN